MMRHEATPPGPAAADHPAWQAWHRSRPDLLLPKGIVTVQERAHNRVYRLAGAGPSRSDVIAKRGHRDEIAAEHAIYAHWLPRLPVPTVRCHGYLEEPGGRFAWLFLERARGDVYSVAKPEHRALLGRWLATVHTAATDWAAAGELPDRGPDFYRNYLRSAHDRLRRGVDHPALGSAGSALLHAMLNQCDRLERRWSYIEHLCRSMPQTLVHGDLQPKNLRILSDAAEPRLLVFDWEYAGRGVPLLDLMQGSTLDEWWAAPDLEAYRAVAGRTWPGLSEAELRLGASIARALHLLVWIDGDAQNLAGSWAENALDRLAYYRDQLAEILRVVRWTE